MAGLHWRVQLLESIAKNKNYDKIPYMQLATLREDGRPANRSVAFLGFHGDTACVLFQTDSRSYSQLGLNITIRFCPVTYVFTHLI